MLKFLTKSLLFPTIPLSDMIWHWHSGMWSVCDTSFEVLDSSKSMNTRRKTEEEEKGPRFISWLKLLGVHELDFYSKYDVYFLCFFYIFFSRATLRNYLNTNTCLNRYFLFKHVVQNSLSGFILSYFLNMLLTKEETGQPPVLMSKSLEVFCHILVIEN